MSHTVTREGVKCSQEGWQKAVARISGAEYLGVGKFKQYSKLQEGIGIKLPGYQYPVVVDLVTNEIASDTYNGKWGDPKIQENLLQFAGVEAAKLEAANKGYDITETLLDNGDIQLNVSTGNSFEVGGGGVAPAGGEL